MRALSQDQYGNYVSQVGIGLLCILFYDSRVSLSVEKCNQVCIMETQSNYYMAYFMWRFNFNKMALKLSHILRCVLSSIFSLFHNIYSISHDLSIDAYMFLGIGLILYV